MSRVDNSIDILAPREKVFSYVSNVEAQPEWVKWARDVEVTSDQKNGVGAVDSMTMQVGPRKERVEALVTEFRPPQLMTRRFLKGLRMEERFSLVPVRDGTKVAWSVEYVPPMGAIGKLFDFLFMIRLMDQLMKDSLVNLKERLEGR